MMIEIADDIFGSADGPTLLGLFVLGLEGRHRVFAMETEPNYLSWHSSLDSWSQAVCTETIKQAVQLESLEPAFFKVLVVMGATAWGHAVPRIDLSDVWDLATRPYRVLLENDSADLAFLRAMMTSDERAFFDRRHDKEWLTIEHCGGIGGVPLRVKRFRKQFKYTSRTSVMFDSDGLLPGDASSQAKKAIKACSSVHHFCLPRRAIENYIPTASIDRWASRGRGNHAAARARKAKAFGRLTGPQRAHFNMKAGFAADGANVAASYAAVPPQDVTSLISGFGKDVAELFQRDIPSAELRADGGWIELRPFVSELIERIR